MDNGMNYKEIKLKNHHTSSWNYKIKINIFNISVTTITLYASFQKSGTMLNDCLILLHRQYGPLLPDRQLKGYAKVKWAEQIAKINS
jgi:hypothetical protein